jgi:hypothetical protein
VRRLAILLLLAGAPALAQDLEDAPGALERGIEQLLRDFFLEMEPRLRELRDAIGDLNNYEAPEMLPNGDIIIRRKTPLEPAPPEPDEEPEAGEGEPVEI